MKHSFITFASANELVVDGEAMLGLSVAKFSKEVVSAVDMLATVHGHTTNRVIGALSGAMRRALNKRVLKAEGLVSASMAGAIMDKDAGKIEQNDAASISRCRLGRAVVRRVQATADILAGLSAPRLSSTRSNADKHAAAAVDNELDAQEHDDYAFDDTEDYMMTKPLYGWLSKS